MGEHTKNGTISIISGSIGLITVFLMLINNIFSYISFVCLLIAIGFGVSARNKGDKYGTYGLILGILTFILMIVIPGIVYFYISSGLR